MRCNAVATRTDFLIRGVVRRRRDLRGLKISSEENERNVHAHSFQFPRNKFSAGQPKDAIGNSDVKIGRVARRVVRVVRRVRFPRPRSSNNTSDEEYGACSHRTVNFSQHHIVILFVKLQLV